MQDFQTDQEAFWAGEFGDDYIDRNSMEQFVTHKLVMWSKILSSAGKVSSAIELGCNIGLNLMALRRLGPSLDLTAYEINTKAAAQARENADANVHVGSVLEDLDAGQVDMTFTSGVLIHINPDHLAKVYANLYNHSRRYVVVSEYYNPSPVSISYRGHKDRLFKRDFAGDLIEQYDMKLVDYGFVYKRDPWAPQDDTTWFLLEK